MKIRQLARLSLLAALVIAPATTLGQTTASWTQWGGPRRDFMSDSTGLASSWPSSGPKKLWSRSLGEGHSSVLIENGRLYTMYRQVATKPATAPEEVVAALDAASGKTLWEFKYPAPTTGIQFDQGLGPHSTPLVAGTRLFAMSSRSELFAIDKATGKRIWTHDLVKEFNAPLTARGYSGSPILYNGTIIVTMGGPDQAVAAFNQETGKLVWKAGYFVWAPASPILIDVDTQPQLVVFGGDIVTGMDPATGRQLWKHPHKTDYGLNISTPVWVPDSHLLFVSSAYGTGTRAIELRQTAGQDDRDREVAHRKDARAHRNRDPPRRLRLRVERRLRSGVHLRDRSEERRDRLAGSELRAGAAALRRRQADRARRGRDARARHDRPERTEGAGARERPREPGVDSPDARWNHTLRPRPEDASPPST